MSRLLSSLLLGVLVCQISGCGGVAEKPAANATPTIDPNKVQKEKEKMYEMRGKKGAPPKTEGAAPAAPSK